MTHPIPNAALDDRLGFIGTSGSGKTYNAGGAVERLLEKDRTRSSDRIQHSIRSCMRETMNRLLRNETDGKGKYSVFNNRKNQFVTGDEPNGPNEHFVLMLKDEYARAALLAYAKAAAEDGQKLYAEDVMVLANRAGHLHPNCKKPD